MYDAQRSRLRTILSRLHAEIGAHDAAHGAERSKGIRASLAELVTALDLGDEPATRDCPTCGEVCMAEAKICSNCWVKLPRAA